MSAPAGQTAIHRLVDAARVGGLPRTVARLSSGWVVLAESQRLPGYCILLPDPVVPALNDLDELGRASFLRDMTAVGDAVRSVCAPARLNYAMLGNLEPALHAHIIPRYDHEPDALRTKSIWNYDPAMWNDPAHAFDPKAHRTLIENLQAKLI